MNSNAETRVWLRHVALSVGGALLAGLFVYLVARGVTGALLFIQQQELLRQVAGTLTTGLSAPPSGDLRAIRLQIEQQDQRNEQLSLILGFAGAALGAVATFVWLERRAARGET